LLRCQTEGVLVGQHARDRADEGDLEAVENPGDAKADDNKPVPTTPGQPIESARNHRLDDVPGRAHPSTPGVAGRDGRGLLCPPHTAPLARFVDHGARRMGESGTRETALAARIYPSFLADVPHGHCPAIAIEPEQHGPGNWAAPAGVFTS
jgi:hypothetical protein